MNPDAEQYEDEPEDECLADSLALLGTDFGRKLLIAHVRRLSRRSVRIADVAEVLDCLQHLGVLPR